MTELFPDNVNFKNTVSVLANYLSFVTENKRLERIDVLILNNFALCEINQKYAGIFVFTPCVLKFPAITQSKYQVCFRLINDRIE